jgi:predicted phage terminase large subunit-like protein
MAWLDDRWLETKERKEMLEVIESYLFDIVEPKYGSDVAAWPEEHRDKFKLWSKLERIDRCEGNLLEFSLEYFSEARNPGNNGNWDGFDITEVEQAPDFHREITDIMNNVSMKDTNAKIAVAAPRGHAKSTYLSKAFPTHELVYRLRKYVLMVSETPKVALANLDWIRNQLKFNKKLREDFGPLLSPRDQANVRDNNEGFIAWTPNGEIKDHIALLESASTGGAIRGRNWNGYRPDLIILDDLEDARPGGNASTSEQREALRDWFSQSVIPLGDPKGKRTAFVYMGTTVHVEALLMQVLYRRSDFKSKVYRAIINMPVNMDLWEECRLIYQDHEDPDRGEKALQFFEDNKSKMTEGSKVLWPEGQPIWKLMTWKWDNSSKAFNTEYMNNPIDQESMIFNPETFTYWDTSGKSYNFNSEEYTIALGLDFAFGRERGDYSASHVIARHKETEVIYVLDSFIRKLKIDDFFEVIVEKVKNWQPDIIAADANAAQEFLATTLERRLNSEGYPASTRLKPIKNRTKKELRIEAMKPDIENGRIRFCKKHSQLLEQFERYGQGANDDGPDSLQMAVSVATKSAKRKAGNAGSYRY